MDVHDPMDERVLRERAAALARAGHRADARPLRRALSFVRGGRRYAVAADHSAGVQALHELLELGDVPQPFVGYTVFRGEPLALFDPSDIFGHEEAPQSGNGHALTYAVVLGGERTRLGLLVDAVEEVEDVDASLFEPCGHPDPLLLGTGARLQVIDAERLYRDPRFLIDQSE